MVPDKFYITTAIDYANGDPHLGHAYEKVGADCIARYRRLIGHRVHFCIGMDEHGHKVSQAAEAAGLDPKTWVDQIAEQFRSAWTELSISNTDFIQTTEPRHRTAVLELLTRIKKGGHFYAGSYAGYYCVGCEAFKLDKDLVDGKCPQHPTREIKWVEEPNYFFRQSTFVPKLLELYDRNPQFVRPPAKMNEVRRFVEGGLQDTSVTRARLAWGIPWPDDPSHSVYVWFDAVINYLSATGFPKPGFDEIWPADLHVIGPDIARFHAAMWPAMLMAADLPTPRAIWSHGWMTFSGARFSKSEGVAVTLREAIDRYGPDPLRYFLLREIPWDSDGNFSWERYDGRYVSELADGYGNLASRVLAMIVKYKEGKTPESGESTRLDVEAEEILASYRNAMDQHLLHQGGTEAWRLITAANGFVEESAPWSLASDGDTDQLDRVLAALARAVARVSVMAFPFMPSKTQVVWEALGLPSLADARWEDAQRPGVAGLTVVKPPPLFPKLGLKTVDV
jgi:methionyl-tRNA synthetase